MSLAVGSQSGISFITEANFGVTPVSPVLKRLALTGCKMGLDKQIITSSQLRPDRMGHRIYHGQKYVSGNLQASMQRDSFDSLFESAFMSTFSAGVLTTGTALKSFTIEDGLQDVGLYRVFTGCVVDKMSLRIQPNSAIALGFDMVGKTMRDAVTPSVAASYEEAASVPVMQSYDVSLKENNVLLAKVSAVSLELDNQLDQAQIIGQDSVASLLAGRIKVSGEMTVYFDSAALLQKFIRGTQTSLAITMQDDTVRYEVIIPHVLYKAADLAFDEDQPRLLTLSFEAMRDNISGQLIELHKVIL